MNILPITVRSLFRIPGEGKYDTWRLTGKKTSDRAFILFSTTARLKFILYRKFQIPQTPSVACHAFYDGVYLSAVNHSMGRQNRRPIFTLLVRI